MIPALNEEDAIGGTIALPCRPSASRKQPGWPGVEIVVVSDGSTDRTAEIAKSYEDVKVIVFEKNRGYGAAIKEGWRQGSGKPARLPRCRWHMRPDLLRRNVPRGRRGIGRTLCWGRGWGLSRRCRGFGGLGNRIYAFLLGLLCGRQVTDTASGMRVVRRDVPQVAVSASRRPALHARP